MPKLNRRPSPALVIACLALFVALGGSGYAAINLSKNSVGAKQIRTGAVASSELRNSTIRSRDIAQNTILGRDMRADTLGPREIAESKLGTVPRATAADTLGGLTAPQLKVGCPADTVLFGDTCIETAPRQPMSPGQASGACKVAGRRLLSFDALTDFYNDQRPLASGGELTGDSGPSDGIIATTVILNRSGTLFEFIDRNGSAARAFRCGQIRAN